MENEINLYKVLEKIKPKDMTDEEYIEWYQNSLITHTVILSKSHMENPHVASNPKNILKWELSHTDDGFEYTIKVKRFKKYSVGAVTNKIDNVVRKFINYFRTLDD